METTYYTLTAREIIVTGEAVEQVSGGEARRLVCLRRSSGEEKKTEDGGKIIDLAAWKAAREEEARLEAEWCAGVDQALEEPAEVPARPRRDHRRPILWGAELLASLAVAGTMVLLMIRICLG